MEKTLFLFTDSFPYGNSEQYLNQEFELLAKKFDSIYVIPINVFKEKRIGFESVNIIDLRKEMKVSKLKFLSNIFSYVSYLIKAKSSFSFNDFKSIHHAWMASDYLFNFINQRRINLANTTVYSYWFYHGALISSFLKKKAPSIRTVSRGHMGDIYNEIKPLNFPILKLDGLDYLLTISDHARKYISDMFPEYLNKVFVSRLGVEDVGSNPKIENKTSYTIVTCSTVTKRKRIDKIAEAIKLLNKNITWVHFGDGDQMEKLRILVEDFPNNINVDLKGWVKNNEVLDFYRNHPVDLFINLSLQEGIPVSIMEAISFGIPVLAYDVYGLKEIINPINGVLLSVNVKSITKAIDETLNSSFLKEEIKQNWKENYSAYENYSRFIEKFLLK
tara:strand:+ start:757 stop:1920 length:1164 start_codon:yes stop_codon:yes gene_type:complete